MIKSLAIIIISLVLLIPAGVLASTNSDPRVFVGDGVSVHEIDLKATEMGNGQVIPVSNFEIEPEDVVQIPEDQNLMIFLNNNDDNKNRIEKVKVIDVEGQETELRSTSSSYRIQGFATGIYSLNVVVDSGSERIGYEIATGIYSLNVVVDSGSERIGYETILVVLEPGEKPESPTTIINNVK